MKKWIALVLSFWILLTMLPAGVFAAEEVTGDVVAFRQELQMDTAVADAGYSEGVTWVPVTSGNPGRTVYTGAMVYASGTFSDSHLVIPAEYMGLPVTQVNYGAFQNCTFLTSASINSAAILRNAFSGCTNLTTVVLGERVEKIDREAFSGCTSLVYNTYEGCNYLGTATNPYYALMGPESTGITSVATHPDTKIIADGAFQRCASLTKVHIGDSVIAIGDSTFAMCESLTDVYIGDSVTYIGNSAFYDTRISTLRMGPKVKEIDDLAFMGSALKTLVLPEGLERIGANAFDGNSVEIVVLPASVTEIGRYAFPNKNSMRHVLYLGTMEQWYQIGIGLNEGIDVASRHYACSDELIAQVLAGSCSLCDGCAHSYVLMADTSTCTTAGKLAYECDRCGHTYEADVAAHHRWQDANCTEPRRCTGGCGQTEGKSLGGHLWVNATCTTPKTCTRCSQTEYGTAPHSWNHTDCTLDKVCTVCAATESARKHYYADGICLDCGDACSTGLRYEQMACYYLVSRGDCSDTQIVIPENHNGLIVFEIGTFGNSDTITAITLPDTAGIIWDSAFANSTALETVTLPNSVREIGASAFSGCTSLQQIDIPSGVKELREGIFEGCAALKELAIPESVTAIGTCAFRDCASLQTITIPDSVTELGAQTFYRCSGLQEVTLGNGLRKVPEYAFVDCVALQKLTIGSGVETIAFRAFYRCSALKELTIPDSVVEISMDAFGYCAALTDVHFGTSLQTIGNSAFSDCRRLENLVIPDSVTVIDNAAFANCEQLTKLDLGNGVQSLGTGAFNGCGKLTEVFLPVSLTTIGDTAFTGCYGVDAIYYEGTLAQWDAVTKPDDWYWMPRPDTPVYCLGQCQAYGHAWTDATCTEVRSCPVCGISEEEPLGHDYQQEVIPPTCETSGYTRQVCSRCGDWFVVEGSWKNPVSHNWEYATCTKPETCTYCGATRGQALGHMEYTYTEPPTCTTPGGTVHGCHRCEETYITDEVPALGHTPGSGPNCYAGQICTVCREELQPALGHDWADATCEKPKTCARCGLTEGAAPGHDYQNGTCTRCGAVALLDEGTFGNNMRWTLDTQGVLTIYGSGDMPDFVYGIFAPWYGSNNYEVKKIVVSEGITSIGNYAFYYCYNSTEVEIPDTVTRIGNSAFFNNSSLQELELGNNVTELGEQAFTKCISLRRISLGTGLTAIGNAAFSGCTALTSIGAVGSGADVELPATLTSVSGFGNCTGLTSVALPGTVVTVGDSAFSGCTGLKSITLPDSVTTIGGYAFQNCTGLTSVTLGAGLQSIGEYSFAGCTGLTRVRIPAKVTVLGSGAFSSCTALTEVILSQNLQTIGDSTFYKCDDLKQIELPWGVTEIGASAFKYCYALQEVTFNPRLTTIGDSAFESCYKLTNVELPEALTTIGERAFYGCDAVTEISIGDYVTSIGKYAFAYCEGLKHVTIGDSVPYIDAYTFSNCGALFYVDLGDGVSQIRDYVFKDCGYLGCMILGSDLSYISSNALQNCTVDHILYKGTEEQWNAITKGSYCPTTRATRHYNCKGNEYLMEPTVRCLLCNPMITIDMYDLGANGWTGNAIWVYVDNALTYKVTLEEGKEGSWSIDYDPTKGYRFEFMNAGDHYSNGQCAFDIRLNQDLVFQASYDDCYNYGSYKVLCTICEHSWQDAACLSPKTCSRCGLTEGYALGHTYGENYRCIRCDAPAQIKVKLEAYGSLGDSYLGVSVNGEKLDAAYVLYNGYYTSLTWTADYEYGSFYEFIWDKEANAKCQIVTITIGKDVVFSASQSDCGSFADGQVIFSICHHTWMDATCAAPRTCANCGATEGEPLDHHYTYAVTILPTIKAGGTAVATCTGCADSFQIELPALSWTDYTCEVITLPADGNPGISRYTWIDKTYGEVCFDLSYHYGDVSGDGKVDGRDVVQLRKYMANYDFDNNTSTEFAFAGADVNGDGVINGQDVILLRRYMANYDFDTGSSTIVLGPQQKP